ncbi:MAG: hypothetical protein HY518_02590 [Candidatus Aenigmarchaeota archaeon]|nr:hypothetical protein [Candidatus Aenigmarchaeota archaeon]
MAEELRSAGIAGQLGGDTGKGLYDVSMIRLEGEVESAPKFTLPGAEGFAEWLQARVQRLKPGAVLTVDPPIELYTKPDGERGEVYNVRLGDDAVGKYYRVQFRPGEADYERGYGDTGGLLADGGGKIVLVYGNEDARTVDGVHEMTILPHAKRLDTHLDIKFPAMRVDYTLL